MVQIAKLPLGGSGQHINLFGDGLKMLFEAVEALLKVSSSETQREFRPRPRGVEHAPPFGYPDSVSFNSALYTIISCFTVSIETKQRRHV
jgi:hypothetical protein